MKQGKEIIGLLCLKPSCLDQDMVVLQPLKGRWKYHLQIYVHQRLSFSTSPYHISKSKTQKKVALLSSAISIETSPLPSPATPLTSLAISSHDASTSKVCKRKWID